MGRKIMNEQPVSYPRQVIVGHTPSKSNSYRVIQHAGHGSLGKADALIGYEHSFFMQCGLRQRNISRRFKLTVDVYFRSDRSDLDNALKIILDCLQRCGAIKNDRLCSEIHARKLIDAANPRIEFEIEEQI